VVLIIAHEIFAGTYFGSAVFFFLMSIFFPILQDLSSKDMKRDLYIVAHVIRIGTV